MLESVRGRLFPLASAMVVPKTPGPVISSIDQYARRLLTSGCEDGTVLRRYSLIRCWLSAVFQIRTSSISPSKKFAKLPLPNSAPTTTEAEFAERFVVEATVRISTPSWYSCRFVPSYRPAKCTHSLAFNVKFPVAVTCSADPAVLPSRLRKGNPDASTPRDQLSLSAVPVL